MHNDAFTLYYSIIIGAVALKSALVVLPFKFCILVWISYTEFGLIEDGFDGAAGSAAGAHLQDPWLISELR